MHYCEVCVYILSMYGKKIVFCSQNLISAFNYTQIWVIGILHSHFFLEIFFLITLIVKANVLLSQRKFLIYYEHTKGFLYTLEKNARVMKVKT